MLNTEALRLKMDDDSGIKVPV